MYKTLEKSENNNRRGKFQTGFGRRRPWRRDAMTKSTSTPCNKSVELNSRPRVIKRLFRLQQRGGFDRLIETRF